MNEKDIKGIVASYFGFTPSLKADKLNIEITHGKKIDAEKIKIRWEEHIGNMTGVARVSPLDIMHQLGLEPTKENEKKAVNIMKSIAHEQNLYFVEVLGKERYLLINPKYRR